DGPSRRLPYGDDPATVRYTGLDGLLSRDDGEDRTLGDPTLGDRPLGDEKPRTEPPAERTQPPPRAEGGGKPAGARAGEDAFAHLFRDQGGPHSGASAAPPQPRSESAFRSEPRGSAPGPY